MKRTLVLALALLAVAVGCKKDAPLEPVAPIEVPPVVEPPKVVAPAHVQDMAANFSRVFFEFDSANLDDASKAALSANVAIMQAHADVKIEVQGHCDERGTTEYNVALGDKRAETVQRYMTALGVSTSRINTVSYGEERPLASGSTEVAWSQNRRAEFRITWTEGGTVTGTTK